MFTIHAPLAYRREGSAGEFVYLCECDYETEPHEYMSGALQQLGEHIANPGDE